MIIIRVNKIIVIVIIAVIIFFPIENLKQIQACNTLVWERQFQCEWLSGLGLAPSPQREAYVQGVLLHQWHQWDQPLAYNEKSFNFSISKLSTPKNV